MKLVFRWEERLEKHTRLMAENNWLAAKAKQLLDSTARVSRREYEDFVGQATKLEDDDRVALGDVPLKQRQRAYRDAIKEFALTKDEAKCPICDASVYTVKPGSCQTCGNTPAKERS
jgi:mobilome CxxCx(11)CxxC protein